MLLQTVLHFGDHHAPPRRTPVVLAYRLILEMTACITPCVSLPRRRSPSRLQAPHASLTPLVMAGINVSTLCARYLLRPAPTTAMGMGPVLLSPLTPVCPYPLVMLVVLSASHNAHVIQGTAELFAMLRLPHSPTTSS